METIRPGLAQEARFHCPDLPSRIPGLDGLRAVSILAVIAGHAAGTAGFPIPGLGGLHHVGNFGVRFFFVISGFLITTLLMKEVRRQGRISLRRFYLRRAIRIFPAFYVFVGIIALLDWQGVIRLFPGDLMHSLTYTMNYHHQRDWNLNHIWSLSVEEQFYLLWPATLAFSGPRRAMQVAAVTVLVAPVVRAGMWFGLGAGPTALMREFQAIADVLALGCLMAGMYNWMGRKAWYLALLRNRFFLLLPSGMLLVSLACYFLRPVLFYVGGQTLANIAIALYIDYCARESSAWVMRLLNGRLIIFIGLLSYSLYLWQEYFLNSFRTSWETSFPQNLVLTFAAALGSYYLVERPALKLKDALERAPGGLASPIIS